MSPVRVELRTGGVQPSDDLPLLIRLGADSDLNMTIKHALNTYYAYAGLADAAGRSGDEGLLTLSAYAQPEGVELATLIADLAPVPYQHYRQGRYGDFRRAGIGVLPTTVYTFGNPDRHADLHFDVVVADEHHVLPDTYEASGKAERKRLRDLLTPAFQSALAPFGPVRNVE